MRGDPPLCLVSRCSREAPSCLRPCPLTESCECRYLLYALPWGCWYTSWASMFTHVRRLPPCAYDQSLIDPSVSPIIIIIIIIVPNDQPLMIIVLKWPISAQHCLPTTNRWSVSVPLLRLILHFNLASRWYLHIIKAGTHSITMSLSASLGLRSCYKVKYGSSLLRKKCS